LTFAFSRAKDRSLVALDSSYRGIGGVCGFNAGA
jgi:hypothetical protein